jgi:hypothetical protein
MSPVHTHRDDFFPLMLQNNNFFSVLHFGYIFLNIPFALRSEFLIHKGYYVNLLYHTLAHRFATEKIVHEMMMNRIHSFPSRTTGYERIGSRESNAISRPFF